MSISFDRVFGIYQQVFSFCVQCVEVLVNNLVNVDILNYKVCDLDFVVVFVEQKDKVVKGIFVICIINEWYIVVEGFGMGEGSLQYCILVQLLIDQNIVDVQIEQVNYVENVMYFQVFFIFFNSKFKGLVSVLCGE